MRKKSYQILRPDCRSLHLSQGFGICPRKCEQKLKRKPFGITQQFPLEIENKRKQLYPVIKEAHENGHFTGMVRDKLYFDNNLYTTKTMSQWTQM